MRGDEPVLEQFMGWIRDRRQGSLECGTEFPACAGMNRLGRVFLAWMNARGRKRQLADRVRSSPHARG